MNKIIIAMALLLAQIASVAASNDELLVSSVPMMTLVAVTNTETPEVEEVSLNTFVKMVEDHAIKCQQEGKEYTYGHTLRCLPKLSSIKSLPLGERYDNLVRLVDICKKYSLNSCYVHSITDTIVLSYTDGYCDNTPDRTGSTEEQRLSFIEIIIRDIVNKNRGEKYGLKIFSSDVYRTLAFAIKQSRSQAVPSELRRRYADFFKTYSRSTDTMRIYHSIMAGIESANK